MLTINLKPFPILETEKLILRRITKKDAPNLFEMRRDINVMRYIGKPTCKTIKEARDLVTMIDNRIKNNEGINWAITLKIDDKLIGNIGLHRIIKEHHRAEIGYMLAPQFWNRGIASEAIQAVINYGFTTLNLHSIEALLDSNNIASKKLLTKFNFVKEAYFKENYFFEGKFIDTEVCSLINHENKNISL